MGESRVMRDRASDRFVKLFIISMIFDRFVQSLSP